MGGGSSYGRYEHESCDILYTLHIVITVQFHENNPNAIQNREHCR